MVNIKKLSFCLLLSGALAGASVVQGAESPEPAEESGILSRLTGIFTTLTPEEREAREAERQAAAEARQKEREAREAERQAERQAAAEARQKDREAREAERQAAAEARQKEREARQAERQAAAEARQKEREAREAERQAERQAAAEARQKEREAREAERQAELKARAEQREREQAERAAALEEQLKAREEARAKAQAEAEARREQEMKARVEAAKAAAAERMAREEARVQADLERRRAREEAVRERMDARARELAEAIEAAEDPEDKAGLQREAEELAEKEEARRAAFAASESEIKARWEARKTILAEREQRALERAAEPVDERAKWRLSAGVIHRTINSQTFKSDSYSRTHPIPAQGRSTVHTFDPAGDTVSYTDRDYMDGYVHRDGYSDLDGGTWNWGYDSGSQVRDDMLVFRWYEQARTTFRREVSVIPGEREVDTDHSSGVYLRAERILKQAGPFDYGLRLDASRVSYSSSGIHMTFSDRQSWVKTAQFTEDSYSIADMGITPDSEPYQGDLETPGPVINNTPDRRDRMRRIFVSSGSYEAYNSAEESLDVDLSTLSLGLSIAGNYRWIYLSGALGPTLTMVDTDASYHETLYERRDGGPPSVLASWNDTRRETEYNVGMFIQGELGLRLVKGLELSVFGRYDWIENTSGTVGPTRYVINPEGGSIGGTVSYAF